MDQAAALNPASTASGKLHWRWTKQALGYFAALVCLVWVLHDIHLRRLWGNLVHINWGLIALAIFFDIASYYCQGVRWELLLRPQGRISLLQTTQAIYAGLFTNEIVPLRPGELVRAYLVSLWLPTDFMAVLPSMAVERLFDGVWLALAIAVAAFYVPLPQDVLEAEEILGIMMIVLMSLFVWLVWGKCKTHKDSDAGWKPLRPFKRFL